MEKIDEVKGRKISLDVTNANLLAIFILLIVALILIVPFFLIWHNDLVCSIDVFFVRIFDRIIDVVDGYLGEMTSSASIFLGAIIIFLVFEVLFLGILFIGGGLYVLIGAITLACYAENGWKSVEFGFKKLLSPYCRCIEPLNVRHFMMSTSMPVIILGIIPAIVSLCIGSVVFLVWAIPFITSGWVDIYITFKLAKEDKNAKVIDIKAKDKMGVYILED